MTTTQTWTQLDIVINDSETAGEVAMQLLERFSLDGYKIVTEHGPGGGWPVVKFIGRPGAIRALDTWYADGGEW